MSQDYISWISFDSMDFLASSICERLANAKVTSIAACMKEVWELTRSKIAKSQNVQVKMANKYQKDIVRQYKIGNKIWYLTKNIKTKHSSKKLDHKTIGSY